MLIETSNSVEISNLFTKSEISLTDAIATSELTEDLNIDCEYIKQSNIDFANRIYEEAKVLEGYEESGKLTDSMELLHKKYDLLRTLVWTNNQESLNPTIEMIFVEGGTFQMGSTEYYSERPIHSVILDDFL
jgi:formylglycine-generating enzyme required for sulfatase activity